MDTPNLLRGGVRGWLRGTDSQKLAWGVSLAVIALIVTAGISVFSLMNAEVWPRSIPLLFGVAFVLSALSFSMIVYSRKFLFPVLLNSLFFAALHCLLIALGFVFWAFSLIDGSHPHIGRVVAPSELHGVWTPTEQTLNFLFFSEQYYLGGEPHFIELNADGSARFRSFKDGAANREGRFGYLCSEGTWEFVPKEPGNRHSHQRVELTLDGSLRPTTHSYYLAERDGRMFLWTSIGDPFAFDYLEHERVPTDEH
jgi:hypothetical protein